VVTKTHPAMHSGAQPTATVLAVLALVAASWPLGRLFQESPWWPSALVAIAAVAIAGLVLRARRVGPTGTAGAQLLLLVIIHSVAFAPREPLLGGLVPTWSTLTHWRDLAAAAGRTIMENAAPAPAPTGIAFLLSAAIGLVAWAVDVVAVGSRMPAVAGLPLLTPLLTAVANSSGTLDAGAVALPLLLWGAMLLEQERDWLASWRPDLAGAHRLPARGRRLLAGATVLAVGLLGGLGAAAALPHLPQRYLADGLGRGEFGTGNRVGFSPDTDLLQDLRSGDRTPILTYTSDDPESPPLRVIVSSAYSDGHWSPRTPAATPSQAPVLPRPFGLTEQVPTTEVHLKVSQTALRFPYLASPVPIVWGTVVGARWAVDDPTGVPVVDATPRSYDITYLALNPTPQALAAAPPAGRGFREYTTPAPEVLTPRFAASTQEAIGDAVAPYERAVRIQQWLRASGGFRYSLDLAPAPPGMDETTAKRTALDRFLETKQGYCVQFATAMVMMARAQGIPARLATGFLPGTSQGTTRVVHASDAHAWPELYFEGAGWLRFEPTPSDRSGPVPRYATGTAAPSATTTTSASQTSTAPLTPTPSQATERPDTDTGAVDAGAAESVWAFWWRLGGGLVLLLAIVPAVAAAVRARRRASARDPSEAAEAEWLILTERLQDLGLDVPAAATPRQLHARVTDTAVLDREASTALQRVLLAVETARYAPPRGASRPGSSPAGAADDQGGTSSRAGTSGAAGGETSTSSAAARALRTDARTVVRGAASLRSGTMRARAALLPRAGLRAMHLPVPENRPPPRH
jgi:transglutaminase-like putative cysteine protease